MPDLAHFSEIEDQNSYCVLLIVPHSTFLQRRKLPLQRLEHLMLHQLKFCVFQKVRYRVEGRSQFRIPL